MSRKELIIDRKRVIVAAILIFIIVVSYLLNRDLMNAPQNQNISSNLFLNYAISAVMIQSGIFASDLSKRFRYPLLGLGLFWFGYLMLHYFIGFHNPYWGN